MSEENKEIISSLADQLSEPAVTMLEKHLGEVGVLDVRPVASLGSGETEATDSRQRLRKKVSRSTADSFNNANMNRLRERMLETLDRQHQQANWRVNLIYTVMVCMFALQFLVLLVGLVMTLQNRVTVNTLKAVVGLAPGVIGTFAQRFYKNERLMLERMDKDRAALFQRLITFT